MTNNVVLIACSMSVLGLTFLYGRFRWSRFNLIDTFVLMSGIYFGGYTLIDALINDLSWVDPVLALWAHLLVIIIAGIIWFIHMTLPGKVRSQIQYRNLSIEWSRVNIVVLILMLGMILTIQAYGFWRFGILSHFSSTDLERLQITMPYWFSSVMSLIRPMLFSVFIAITAKVALTRGGRRMIMIVLLLVMLSFSMLYGRRSLINHVLVLIVIFFSVRRKNIFSLRGVVLMVVLLPLLFVFSNVYQNYRTTLLRPGILIERSELPSLEDTITDSTGTLSNLSIRMAMWQYNYLIVEKQSSHNDVGVPYGDIAWQAFKNAIPRLFWPNKIVYDLDKMVADWYGLPVKDYPTNNYAVTQADFGYLSILVLPLQMTFLFLVMTVPLKISRRYPTYHLLVTGLFLHYLINIENNYADVFLLVRNIALVSLIWLVSYLLVGFSVKSFRGKVRSSTVRSRFP